jgi:hypothetical protein
MQRQGGERMRHCNLSHVSLATLSRFASASISLPGQRESGEGTSQWLSQLAIWQAIRSTPHCSSDAAVAAPSVRQCYGSISLSRAAFDLLMFRGNRCLACSGPLARYLAPPECPAIYLYIIPLVDLKSPESSLAVHATPKLEPKLH